ncbi:MAG: hypothetical protein Q6366_007090 [Candidatus Freyarchaeota archaeon]
MVTEGFAVMKCPHCRNSIGIYYVMGLKKGKAAEITDFNCPHCNENVAIEISRVAVDKFNGFQSP